MRVVAGQEQRTGYSGGNYRSQKEKKRVARTYKEDCWVAETCTRAEFNICHCIPTPHPAPITRSWSGIAMRSRSTGAAIFAVSSVRLLGTLGPHRSFDSSFGGASNLRFTLDTAKDESNQKNGGSKPPTRSCNRTCDNYRRDPAISFRRVLRTDALRKDTHLFFKILRATSKI